MSKKLKLSPPTGYKVSDFSTLWNVDDKVAVFKLEHAEKVFLNHYPGLQVWGIKGTTANLLTNCAQAVEFFGEEK